MTGDPLSQVAGRKAFSRARYNIGWDCYGQNTGRPEAGNLPGMFAKEV